MEKMVSVLHSKRVKALLERHRCPLGKALLARVNFFALLFETHALGFTAHLDWLERLLGARLDPACVEALDSLDIVDQNLSKAESRLRSRSVALLDFMRGPSNQWLLGLCLLLSKVNISSLAKAPRPIFRLYLKGLFEKITD